MLYIEKVNLQTSDMIYYKTICHNYTYSQKVLFYCAFDIFQKVVFCLALYTEEVNLQTFVMIKRKTIRHEYLCA